MQAKFVLECSPCTGLEKEWKGMQHKVSKGKGSYGKRREGRKWEGKRQNKILDRKERGWNIGSEGKIWERREWDGTGGEKSGGIMQKS